MSAIDDIAVSLPRPRASWALVSIPVTLALAVATGLTLQALDRSIGTDDPAAAGPYPQIEDWRGNSGRLPAAE